MAGRHGDAHGGREGEPADRGPAAALIRWPLVAFLHVALFTVAYGAVMPAEHPPVLEPGPIPVLAALAIVGLANAAVVTWLVARSGAPRLRLVAAIFLALWGVQTFLAEIEVVIFPAVARRMPEGFVLGAMLAGALHAGLFAPLAVAVLGAWRRSDSPAGGRSGWRRAGTAWRIGVAAAAFVTLYFTCGYFIAWRQPVLAAYYDGADPGSFAAQMRTVVRDTPWLPAVQAARGILWTLFMLPAVTLLRRSRVETVCFAAALCGITSLVLLLPNPFMPFDVRMIHLVETVTANTIFGAFVGWMFVRDASRNAAAQY